jgi:hypothetical protein
MAEPKKNGAAEGAEIDRAGGHGSNVIMKVQSKSNTDFGGIASASTASKAQLVKLLALLRQGPKTTIDLRHHAIMMPAARVFQLKREQDCNIVTELVDLYDDQGVRHRKCARYHLVEQAAAQGTLDLGAP